MIPVAASTRRTRLFVVSAMKRFPWRSDTARVGSRVQARRADPPSPQKVSPATVLMICADPADENRSVPKNRLASSPALFIPVPPSAGRWSSVDKRQLGAALTTPVVASRCTRGVLAVWLYGSVEVQRAFEALRIMGRKLLAAFIFAAA